MKIYIATVHFGDKLKLTKEFVQQFFQIEQFEEIVIANNNKDNLKIKLPHVKVINNKKNLGWGGGINSTFPYILSKKPDYVFIVNNDCILEKPILEKLSDFLEKNKDAGIVSPVLKFENNRKHYFDLGGFINYKRGEIKHKNSLSIKSKKPYEIDFSGTVLVKEDVLRKIKGFDENFFLYMEDVDFCLRAKKIGYKIFIQPSAVISHLGSATVGRESPKAVYHQTRSSLLFVKKYFGFSINSLKFYLTAFVVVIRRLKHFYSGRYALLAIYDLILEKNRLNS
ncbi:MAG: glycosyltransferase family 2 protein [Candidatus Levybacteria bacterium]|nr:glycosyltransferase family 2 protein [Candidatus Levybacteria bacterium]